MHLGSVHAASNADSISIERLQGGSKLADSDKIGEAARQFEAILVRQILTAARKTVIQSDLHPKSVTADVYEDMLNTQLADAISRAGSFGLANSLQGQLQHQAGSPPESREKSLEASAAIHPEVRGDAPERRSRPRDVAP